MGCSMAVAPRLSSWIPRARELREERGRAAPPLCFRAMALSPADRRLVRLFTACVLGRFDVVRELRSSAVPPEPDRRWREAVLQVHVFAGFPRLVEAYGVLALEGGLGEEGPDE